MNKIYFSLFSIFTIISNLSSQTTLDATLLELNWRGDSFPRNIVENNNKLYFSASEPGNGRELWSFDLGSSTASLVKDINPGSSNGLKTSEMIFVDDILYFLADDSVNGYELWRSNGTEIGTYMLKNISNSGNSSINNMVSYNGNLIFSANDNINGQELWISDGTEGGTHLIKDINPGPEGSGISSIFEFNELLFFTADNGSNGNEIWQTDGTVEGTSILMDIGINENSGLLSENRFIVFDNYFYFLAQQNNMDSYDLWKSDGTASGTVFVKEILGNSLGSIYGAATEDYFVFITDTSSKGREMWISDGTDAGTSLLLDINPGSRHGIPDSDYQVVASGNKVFFVAKIGFQNGKLWVTDGTEAGTHLVKDTYPNGSNLIESIISYSDGSILFSAKTGFAMYKSLWMSDGTEEGTYEVKYIDLNTDNEYAMQFLQVGNKFYFPASDALHGAELWETDGTPENTLLIADFNRLSGSLPQGNYNTHRRYLEQLNDKFIFVSTDGINGGEPFVTDGTVAGTKMIRDIYPDYYSSIITDNNPGYRFVTVGENAFFRAGAPGYGQELYKTDGTEANTIMVKDIAPGNNSGLPGNFYYMVYNDIFYFKADDQVHGMELWRSDGTETGTYILKDINPGSEDGILNSNARLEQVNHHAIMNGLLYFEADNGMSKSIWSTDGTEAGTVEVIVNPHSGGMGPKILNAIDGKLFFTTSFDNSTTLWVSDGTQNNTSQIESWSIGSAPVFRNNHSYNGELYFISSSEFGKSLTKTDGTIAGTVIIRGGLFGYQAQFMGECGDFLYVAMGDTYSDGFELYRTDGTPEGTVLLAESIWIKNCTCIEDELAFLDGYNNRELWVTDGYSKHTMNINVLNDPLMNDISLYNIEGYAQNKLYVSAKTPTSGNELYVVFMDGSLSSNDYIYIRKFGDDVIVYPNPTKGSLTITSKEKLTIQAIELFDFSGKKIMAKDYSSESVNINIGDLPKGIYLIKVKTNNSVFTKKVILH